VFTDMYFTLRRQGLTASQQLSLLHDKYGYFATKNRYFFCYDPAVMKQIFDEMRNGGKYMTEIGEFALLGLRDLTVGFDNRPAHMPRSDLPVTPSVEMISFYFKNGGYATLRGSGTEPKLKYYVEMSGSNRAQVHETLDKLVSALIDRCLQPKKFGLVPPAD